MSRRERCDAVQTWRVGNETVRLVCVYTAGHPGEHAAAVLEPVEQESEQEEVELC